MQNKTFPILEIIRSSIYDYVNDKYTALFLPLYLSLILSLIKLFLFIGISYFVGKNFLDNNNLIITIILKIFEIALFTLFSVFIIRGEKIFEFSFKLREYKFIINCLLVSAINILPIFFLINITGGVTALSSLFGILWDMLVISRIILIIPSVAIGNNHISLKESISLTKNNWLGIFISETGLKIIIIFGILSPYLLIVNKFEAIDFGIYGVFLSWIINYLLLFFIIGITSKYLKKIYLFFIDSQGEEKQKY